MSARVDFFDERSAEDILCAPAPFSLPAAQEPAETKRRIELSVLFHHVLTMGASDLHIGVGMPPMARVCGALTPIGSVELTDADVDEIIRQVFHDDKATRDALERNRSLDLSFSWPVDGRRVRFRGNCFYFYELNRRAASFRVIPETIRSIDELGLPRILHDIAQQRRGLFLVTGPTGHGKSTTLAALTFLVGRAIFANGVFTPRGGRPARGYAGNAHAGGGREPSLSQRDLRYGDVLCRRCDARRHKAARGQTY